MVGGVDGRLHSAAARRLRYPISRPRTPNDKLRARTDSPTFRSGIDALFGTLKSQPVYPGYFADVPAAVTPSLASTPGTTTGTR